MARARHGAAYTAWGRGAMRLHGIRSTKNRPFPVQEKAGLFGGSAAGESGPLERFDYPRQLLGLGCQVRHGSGSFAHSIGGLP